MEGENLNLVTLGLYHGNGTAPVSPVELDNLYPALVECFGIIFLGYLAGKFNFVSDVEAKGLGTFVGTFALPALIFGSLCKLDMSAVQWTFLLGILIAKSILFFLVLLVSLFAVRPLAPEKAGLYSIFVTQSNDFALGFPILQAIYGQSHPECPMYLYLIAPISLVILNPIGFVCMEIGNARNSGLAEQVSNKVRAIRLVRNIITNPIIFMTVAGVAGNFVFQSGLPALLDKFLTTLGSAFSASALFLLGIRMVGNKQGTSKTSQKAFIVPLILIMLKTMALPLIAREVVSSLKAGEATNETEHLSDFAFIYGTFPTAPSVFVFASKYDVEVEMTATAMVACTFVAAPIMFVSARLLSLTDLDPSDYINELDTFLFDISIVGLLATIWVTFVFFVTKKYERVPHFMTCSLAVSQGIACVGAILWSVISCTHGWKLYLQFIVFAFGVYATRINAALLSITVFLMQVKPPCFLHQWKKPLLAFGFGIPAAIVLALLLSVSRETAEHGQKTDPNFQYGETQQIVALVVLFISFSVSVVMMVLTQRYKPKSSSPTSPQHRDDTTRHLLDLADSEEEVTSLNSPGGYNSISRETRRHSPVPIEDMISNPTTNGRGANGAAADNVCSQTGCQTVGGCDSHGNGNGNSTNGSVVRRGRYRCDSEHRAYCSSLLDSYAIPPGMEAVDSNRECRPEEDESQFFRHNMLLLLLVTSMFVGIALCLWTLVMEGKSGLYLELVFLDGFLNFGQGIFAFAIFGVDSNYITVPVRRFFRRLLYGADSMVLPDWEDLEPETKQHCQQFLKHHVEKCMEGILKDVRCRLTSYRAVFRGTELVDWLLEVGLARDRLDAVTYARHLVRGRVLRHVDNYLDFYDDCFIYTFVPLGATART